jgi:hypothetical protein
MVKEGNVTDEKNKMKDNIYTLRPKIFAPFDFYRERLTIRLIQKIVQMQKQL